MLKSTITLLCIATLVLWQPLTCLTKVAEIEDKAGNHKRSVSENYPSNGLCGRVSKHVDFSELGLDYILSPPSADIGDCVGFCPELIGYNLMSNYAKLRLRLDPTSYSPCCAPTEFKPLTVIGRRRSNETDKYVHQLESGDLVVKSCGCR